MRTLWFSIATTLLIAGVAAASIATRPLQHGASQGVSLSVYAPGRAVFDLTHASANVRRQLRAPRIEPGCVKARLIKGQWKAEDVFGPTTSFARRIQVDLGSVTIPPGPSGVQFRAPYDGCEIGGLYGHRWNDAFGTRDALEIWLTVRGRHFFNDRAAARDLAYFVRSRRVHQIRLSATPRVGLDWFVRRYPGRVVAMAKPTEQVPRHVVGFWIGRETITFTVTSSTHRRFFVVARRGTYKLPLKNLGDLAFVF
jgi:hypothetical protein